MGTCWSIIIGGDILKLERYLREKRESEDNTIMMLVLVLILVWL